MRDVRMRGFAERVDVEAVEKLLTESSQWLESEPVAVGECDGRVLAQPVMAPVSVPAFARSAMDGYAVRGEDTFGASDSEPLALAVIGECLPGHHFAGNVDSGQAVRIMTGAPLPRGADAVVPVEVCQESDGVVEISEPVPPKKHVGAVGEDIREGEVVLAAGRRLRAQDAAVVASLGLAEIPCIRRPRVDLFSTGDELVPVGSAPAEAQIVDANSVLLRALVGRDGGLISSTKILPDRIETIRQAIGDGRGDVLLISGGSSVGQEDHNPRLLEELGSLDFHGVSMRPSSPAGGGRIGDRFVFLLPGNPVSCLCAYEFFAGPTIRNLGGRSRAWPHRRLIATLGRKIVSQVGRTDYVRVALERGRIVPVATSGAAILSSTVKAVGAVVVPRRLEGFAAGSEIEVLLYDDEPQVGDGGSR